MTIIHGEQSPHFFFIKTNQFTLLNTPFVSESTLECKGLRCLSFIPSNVLQYSVLTTTNFYSVCIFSEFPLFSVGGQILKIHHLLVRALAQSLNNTDITALLHLASNDISMDLKDVNDLS